MNWTADWGLRFRMTAVVVGMVALYAAFVGAAVLYLGNVLGVVAVAFVLVGAQYWYGPRLALRTVDGRRVGPDEYPDLHDRVGRLAQQAGVPVPDVAVADRPAPNAFATGRTRGDATLCVTTGLLERLDGEELDAVLAHELAHVKNRDVVVLTVVSFMVLVAGFVVRYFWLFDDGGGDGGGGDGGQPWFLVFFAVAIVTWIGGYLLTRAVSRYREYTADRGAAAITGKPAALASALQSIEGAMIPDEDLRESDDLNPSMNALFFFPEDAESTVEKLMRTHPDTESRIERLRAMEGDLSGR